MNPSLCGTGRGTASCFCLPLNWGLVEAPDPCASSQALGERLQPNMSLQPFAPVGQVSVSRPARGALVCVPVMCRQVWLLAAGLLCLWGEGWAKHHPSTPVVADVCPAQGSMEHGLGVRSGDTQVHPWG